MMLHHRAISRAFAVCCALAIAASACAAPRGAASDAQPGATSGPSPDSTAPGGSVPTTNPTAPARYVGPIDQFLGFGNGKQPTEADRAQEQQDLRAVEQQIATCMQEQGFQYIAVEPNNDRRNRKEAMLAMPPGDFAAQYGYGITTMDFQESSAANPNDAIVEAMTVPERSAYFLALYGSLITIDANGRPVKPKQAGTAPPPGAESCAEKADVAVFGPRPEADTSASQDAYVDLQNSINALNDSIHSDPRLTAAMTAWTDCMEARGHPGYTSFDAGQDEVRTREDEVIGDKATSEVDPAVLTELRAFEITVATDEYQCSLPYESVHEAVQTEVEQAFIDEHRAELEQLRDAIAAGTAGKGKG
jgi:hypothetical protein